MQKSKLTKLLCLVLSLMMILCAAPLTVFAADTETVAYLDADGKKATAECKPLIDGTEVLSGWYFVDGSVTMNPPYNTLFYQIDEDTHIILKDGAHLTFNSRINCADGRTLAIYTQSTGNDAGTADMLAHNEIYYCIGNLTVNGGKVNIKTDGTSTAAITLIKGALAVNHADVTIDLKSSKGGTLVTGTVDTALVSINGGSLKITAETSGSTGLTGIKAANCDGGAVSVSGGGSLDMQLASTTSIRAVYANAHSVITVTDGTVNVSAVTSASSCDGIYYSGSTNAVEVINGTVNISSSKEMTNKAALGITADKIEVAAEEGNFSEWDKETSLKTYKYARITSHTHSFAEEWSYDANGHWHVCTPTGCDIKDYSACGLEGAAYGAHTDADGDFYCDVCNYYDEEAAEKAAGDPEDPKEPDEGKYPKCNDHVTGFCTVYNSFRNTPVLNVIFNIIHQILHAIKDFI